MKKKIGEFEAYISSCIALQSHLYGCAHTIEHRHAPYNRQFCTQWVRTANHLVGETLKDLTTARVRVNSHIVVVVEFEFSFLRCSNDFNESAKWAVSLNLVMVYVHRQQICHLNNHLYWFLCIVHLTQTTATFICYINVVLHRLHNYFIY